MDTWYAHSEAVKNSEVNQCAFMEYLICEYIAKKFNKMNYTNSLVGMILRYHTNKNVFNKKNVFRLKYICDIHILQYPFAKSLEAHFELFIRPLFDMYNNTSNRLEFVLFSHVSKSCNAGNKIAFFFNGNSLAKQRWKMHITSFLESKTLYEQFIENDL